MDQVPVMDGTAFQTFNSLLDASIHKKIKIIILNIQKQPYFLLEKYGFIPKFGEENFCYGIDEAAERTNEVLAQKHKEKEKEKENSKD